MTAFTSTRLVTTDIRRLVDFYSLVSGSEARWLAPVFAEFVTRRGTLAIGAAETMTLFGPTPLTPDTAGSAIIEFRVADVDAEAARLAEAGLTILQPPTTMPWGNRSLLIADPEGRLVNLFAPVTEAAKARYAES